MSNREKSFIFYLTGAPDNDAAVKNYIHALKGYSDAESVMFRLSYTVPYQKFNSIRDFQYAASYRPFYGKATKKSIAVIDLSEWVGHEKEEYLEIFFKYLHDFEGFYDYRYVITAGAADRNKARGLFALASEYLCKGEVVEDRTMSDPVCLANYIEKRYPLNRSAANGLARIITGGPVIGIARLDTILRDFLERFDIGAGDHLTKTRIIKEQEKMENSKLRLFYAEGLRAWLKEAETESRVNKERGEAA